MPYGQDSRHGISFQSSYGTANTSSLHWLEPINESIGLKKAQNTMKGIRGVFDKNRDIEGANTVDGDVTIEAKPNALGVFLAACNASSLSITSASLYTHTFKPRTADAQALCAERPFTYLKYLADGGSAHQYYDLNGNNLELSISNGALMTAKLGVVGGSFSRIAAVAATYSASNPIDWSVSSVTIGGTAMDNVRALTIVQNNNLEARNVLSTTKSPDRIMRNDARTIEINGTLLFDDQTELNMFINQSEQQLKVFLRDTSLVQSGYYGSLLIDVPAMKFTEFPTVVGGPGPVEVSFKAMAQYSVDSACAITYTLACGKLGF